MRINLTGTNGVPKITVRDLVASYKNDGESGVVGYGGKLNIRPAYQREFIYKEKQRDEVIKTVRKNFPLNTMYWVITNDGNYELMDGQQRTISICQYVNDDFGAEWDGNPRSFNNLTESEKDQFLDYELSIYICEGNEDEKLDWFQIINIAGEKLSNQELRNAIYTGTWLNDAKRWFSKSGAPAIAIGDKYLTGTPIRQEYLETAIEWIANRDLPDLSDDEAIKTYMSKHQHDPDAGELWRYFQGVIDWVETVFSNYRKEMKGVNWGTLYNQFKDKQLFASELEKEVARLMADEDVTKKSGIYEYVLTGNERALSIRAFNDKMKREVYERQDGICAKCNQHFELEEMEADHIRPWSEGGTTTTGNCQLLCKNCNRVKSDV